MAERIDEEGEDMGRLPPEEVDNDLDDDVDRLFELMHEGEEDEEEEVEDEQPLDTEASESYELDSPAERSGHIAVIDRNIMFVWGGYKVRRSCNNDHCLPSVWMWTRTLLLFWQRTPRTTDSLTCTCREMRSGPTTSSQEYGNSCYLYIVSLRYLKFEMHKLI